MNISRERLADALHRSICERRGELVGHKRDMDVLLADRILDELKDEEPYRPVGGYDREAMARIMHDLKR